MQRLTRQPLSSILNLPLIHLTPHTPAQIAQIWTTFHASHPTLSASYLSATLPSELYASMLDLASGNPSFVLPLPKMQGSALNMEEYDMYYLQWLLHAPPSSPTGENLPATSSILLTPLDEFRGKGEWAQPYLVLSHYPDLGGSHGLVLMRGEITAASADMPGSSANPGWMVSQEEAQLLALALQRFYCAGIVGRNETEAGKEGRQERVRALREFREKPGEWDWTRLVRMAYGGMV